MSDYLAAYYSASQQYRYNNVVFTKIAEMMNLNDKVQLKSTLPLEQMRLLYSGLPMTMAVSLVIAALLTALEWPLVNHTRLLTWFALYFLVLAIRTWSLVSMRRSATNPTQLIWLSRFRLGVFASSLMWGLGGYWMFPIGDPVAQYWLTLILLGVSAMGAASHSVDRISAMFIGYIPFFPIVILLMLSPQVSIILPVMGLFYLFYVAVNSRRMQNNQLNNKRPVTTKKQ